MNRRVAIVLAALLPQIMLAQGNLVTFSRNGGFYEESFALSLQCEGDFQIRYTTNGSTPTAQSELYASPLWLDEALYSKSNIYTIQTAIDELFYAPESVQHCITLRAAAFDDDGHRVGSVVTRSYFIRSLDCDTHDLPVMAISADSLELFDYERGILIPGANFDPNDAYWTGNFYESGKEWERLVNVEFYEPSDNSGINQQAGLRTHGGTCRRQLQKGLKIYARDEYGEKRFRHKFFESIPIESFKHLVIKPFSYHWFNYGIQDDICNRMATRLDVESLASRPMVLFLNGEYWGIYYLKEKPDVHYLEDHFDNDDEDYNMVGNWYGYQEDGDTTGFVEMMEWLKYADLAQDADYERFNEMVDVGSFIDYYCLELFIGNKDWPANNMRCYQLLDGKWRWIFFDGDDALHDPEFDVFDNATSLENIGWPTDSQSTLMFRKLLENEDFKFCFFNRFKELMATEFGYAVTKTYFDDAAALVRAEIPAQCDRFGMPYNPEQWEYDLRTIDRFLYQRVADMNNSMMDFFVTEDKEIVFDGIYPNPVVDDLHLLLRSDGFSVVQVEVFDVMGRRLLTTQVILRNGENEVQLPCRYASGLYCLCIGNQIKRFIIQ